MSDLAPIRQLFDEGLHDEASAMLRQFIQQHAQSATRDKAGHALLAELGHDDPRAGAMFAIAAGALVENGADADPLARALAEPLERALVAADRFVTLVEPLDDADDDTDEADLVYVGHRSFMPAAIEPIVERDPEAASAFFSLDTWYRPAAAAWTRAPHVLASLQQNASLRRAVESLRFIHGVKWLAALMHVPFDERYVFLLPELGEGWEATLTGVADMGQLWVLLADVMREPLGRLGIAAPPPEMIACMQGETAQELDVYWASQLRCYPWQCVDAQGMPRDRVFTWTAPGGTGNHSFPPDYLPGDVTPLNGVRVVIVVGPGATNTLCMTREMKACRAFSGLRASIRDVKQLAKEETSKWQARVLAGAAPIAG